MFVAKQKSRTGYQIGIRHFVPAYTETVLIFGMLVRHVTSKGFVFVRGAAGR